MFGEGSERKGKKKSQNDLPQAQKEEERYCRVRYSENVYQ
jgi:hypothetical protein